MSYMRALSSLRKGHANFCQGSKRQASDGLFHPVLSTAPKIAVVGGGSWATALVKILCEQLDYVGWWIRSKEQVDHIRMYHHNPRYLSSVELPTELIDVHDDLEHIVSEADVLIFAIPLPS